MCVFISNSFLPNILLYEEFLSNKEKNLHIYYLDIYIRIRFYLYMYMKYVIVCNIMK